MEVTPSPAAPPSLHPPHAALPPSSQPAGSKQGGREDTTEEYPIAEDVLDDANNSNNNMSMSENDEGQRKVNGTTASTTINNKNDNNDGGSNNHNSKDAGGGGGVGGGGSSQKANGVRQRKKRKKKKIREKHIPLPDVGPGETLVPIHTVWTRGKRMKGGHVVKVEDKVVRYIDSKGVVYNLDDNIYLDTKDPEVPFYICTITSFSLKKRDTLSLVVRWFFRVSELPFSVRDHLLQDRYTEHEDLHGTTDTKSHRAVEPIIKDPKIKSRELFISKSNATDTYPISRLRGKCQVVHYQDIRSATAFKPQPDVFFYVLGYNPQTKRLATTQGEIRVGSSHQALLPQCKPNLSPSQMPEECHDYEDIQWRPNRVEDSDLIMYLRAARSIAAFAGMCDGAVNDMDGAASADDTTINAMDILHKHNYDTTKGMQALVKCPAMKTIEKKWSDEDSKRFVRGLKQHGKNFYLIRKTLLPCRQTGELIEYYYFWKKTQNALSNRSQVKKIRKGKKTTRSSQPDIDFLDHSSVSECSDESEDSDGGRDLSNYTCQHCLTNISRDWHHAGKERSLLCTECRLFFKKYGEDRPLDGDKDTPSFFFKPVKEDDETINGKHNMRTRRGNSAGETKGKKSECNSTSSPDIEGASNKLGRNSPSSGSCSSNEKDSKDRNNTPSKPDGKNRKRRAGNLEGKIKKNRSDSESMLDSSDASGNEDLGNEADSDDNNQDDLSASSQPSTPSSLDTEFKSAKDYIKPEPIAQSPLAGLPHPHAARPATATTSTTTAAITTTTTTTSSCTTAPVVTASQDSTNRNNPPPPPPPLGFGVAGRFVPNLGPPVSGAPGVLPVGANFGDLKPPLGLYPHLASIGNLPPSQPPPPRVSSEGSAVSVSSETVGLPPPSVGLPPPPTPVGLSGLPPGLPPPPPSVGLSVSSLVSSQQPLGAHSASSSSVSSSSLSSLSSLSSSSPSSSLPSAAASSTTLGSSSSTMTSMSSTGVTLMSSGSGGVGDSEREKKYTPPQPLPPPQPQPIPGMAGSLFTPYGNPYYPYAHLGPPPRLAGPPPPPVPSLVPIIKKEPGEPGRGVGGGEGEPNSKDSSSEPSHTLHRPLPQSMSSSSSSTSSSSLALPSSSSSSQHQQQQSEQKLPPTHMPVPPPLTSIDSSSMPGSLVVERGGGGGGLVGPADSLRDNSREAILRESREMPLLGGGAGGGSDRGSSSSINNSSSSGGGVSVGGGGGLVGPPPSDLSHHPPRSLFPPPLTSLPPSATVTSSSLPPSLAGNLPHHLPNLPNLPGMPGLPMGPGDRGPVGHLRMDGGPPHHFSNEPPSRQDPGIGIPPSLRPGVKVEDGGIVEEVVDDSDSDREGSTTPGPNPVPCNKEVHRSSSAIFIKVLDRGDRNCCSRCDLVFKPMPSSTLATRREERARKPPSSTTTSSSSSSHQSSRDDKPRERRPETPPKTVSVESQGPSSSMTSQAQHGLYPERHTPRPYQDSPALRQLSEFARPHAMGQDQRSYMGLTHPHIDPLASYRHLAMYPPGSRERLELELERDKRERDARERELRERELRDMEMREKMKADMDLKPPGMPASKAGLERLLPPGANPLDPHWLELQRRFAYPPGAGLQVIPHGAPGAPGAPGAHLPGVYPPVSLAGELAAREREKQLERLGHHHPLPVDLSYASAVERLSADRQHAERLGLVAPSNPEVLARLQMAGLANNPAALAAAAMHAHTHAHTHSHTHLHLHQQQENNLAAAAALAAASGGAGAGGGGGGGPPPPPPPLPGHIHPMAHHLYSHLPHADAQQLEQMSTQFIYQYYMQRGLSNDQLVYMQRVTNELYLRTKNDRGVIDPAQLIYQFSRADPMAGLPSGTGTPSSLPSMHPSTQLQAAAASREQAELLQRELYNRAAYMDPALAHQLSAQAHHEAVQLQRQLALERERFGPASHMPH